MPHPGVEAASLCILLLLVHFCFSFLQNAEAVIKSRRRADVGSALPARIWKMGAAVTVCVALAVRRSMGDVTQRSAKQYWEHV